MLEGAELEAAIDHEVTMATLDTASDYREAEFFVPDGADFNNVDPALLEYGEIAFTHSPCEGGKTITTRRPTRDIAGITSVLRGQGISLLRSRGHVIGLSG